MNEIVGVPEGLEPLTDGLVADLLRRPYARLVMPEADGTYRGEILEFPGCLATGDTAADVLSNLEDAARDWLMAVIARGQAMPAPIDSAGFSGKLVLRLPKSLHKKATRIAEREGVSLNQFIVYALAEQVGEKAKSVTRTFFGQD